MLSYFTGEAEQDEKEEDAPPEEAEAGYFGAITGMFSPSEEPESPAGGGASLRSPPSNEYGAKDGAEEEEGGM